MEMVLSEMHQFAFKITQTRSLLTENDSSCSFQAHVDLNTSEYWHAQCYLMSHPDKFLTCFYYSLRSNTSHLNRQLKSKYILAAKEITEEEKDDV